MFMFQNITKNSVRKESLQWNLLKVQKLMTDKKYLQWELTLSNVQKILLKSLQK
jgi:hypothetical protein